MDTNTQSIMEMINKNEVPSVKLYLLLIKSPAEQFLQMKNELATNNVFLTAIPDLNKKTDKIKEKSGPTGEDGPAEYGDVIDDSVVGNVQRYSLYLNTPHSTTLVGSGGSAKWFIERGFTFV